MSRFPTDLVTVAEAPDPLSAEAIAAILRDARIETYVVRPPAPGLGPVISPELLKVPVRVHSADLVAARRVLATRVEESADIDWDEIGPADGSDGPLPRRRGMPLLAMAGWALAASIIVLLLVTVVIMIVTH